MDITINKLFDLMLEYDKGDPRRINHFIKVHEFTKLIGDHLNLTLEDKLIVQSAAILHDIGIHLSEEIYHDTLGKHQEELGPAEAEKLLEATHHYTPNQCAHILYLIANHHSYDNITDPLLQILVEADFLVNAYEDNMTEEAILTFAGHVFRNQYSFNLLCKLFDFHL